MPPSHPDAEARNPRTGLLDRRALLGLGLGLAACLPARAQDAAGYEWRPWPRGKAAPALDLPLLDGGRWQLARQRGKVVLANFWATWCEPCRAEMPSLARFAARHADEGLTVVTVNYRERPAVVRRFVAALGLDLPVLLDSDGEAAITWTPRIFPTTVVLQRDGRPAGLLVGEIDWQGDAARELLAPLLAAPAGRRA